MAIYDRLTLPETNRAVLALPQLRGMFDGQVIAPEDEAYNPARVVSIAGIDRRPAVIIQVANSTDVIRAIALAHESGLELAVRSGGHSLLGHGVSDGGIVIDLRNMKALEIYPQSRTAWAETGLTAGEYTAAADGYDLATGFGDTASVGIGGITLGGGVGYLVRKHGLTIDNLLAAELVTADGQLLQVDNETHPDLFWALRGGGGNFGVATRFKFQLHEINPIVGGMLILPATADVIASFFAEAEAAPEELSAIVNILHAPPMPFLPAEVHGKPILMAQMVYAGEVEAGLRALAPFRALAKPIVDMLRPMRYLEMYPPAEPSPFPWEETASLFLNQVDRSTAATILDRLQASRAPMCAVQLRVLGGALARVPVGATAYAHRQSRILAFFISFYASPDQQPVHKAWVDELTAAVYQGDPGVYVNFLSSQGNGWLRAAYPGETWERLKAIKARYDPTNLFHLNHNIPPA